MKMKLTVVTLLLCSFSSIADTGAMQPGEWEYRMETVLPGITYSVGALTQRVCLKAEEAKYGVLWVEGGKKGACHFENWQQQGNTTTYDMNCPDSDNVSGRFTFTVDGDTAEGNGVITTGTAEVVQKWRATRIGGC